MSISSRWASLLHCTSEGIHKRRVINNPLCNEIPSIELFISNESHSLHAVRSLAHYTLSDTFTLVIYYKGWVCKKIVSACEDRFIVLLFIAFQSAHDDIKNSKSHSLSTNDDKRTSRRRGVAQEMQSLTGEWVLESETTGFRAFLCQFLVD